MKLFLVLIFLLFEVPSDVAWQKKCFNNVQGYCRKKCNMGEIYDVSCQGGKLCCVNEAENKKYLAVPVASKAPEVVDQNMDYIVLPTTTVVTVQL
ncbi:beta-defensin 128 [Erinaceus europaeus]|uniref:Beta-defensin n=1 Tax=Erinaceus europaeus TaxID=9365 RepID=A0A1S3WB26_ERIEU|nr:beta-defensin 128 [Erinaceus europaeus]